MPEQQDVDIRAMLDLASQLKDPNSLYSKAFNDWQIRAMEKIIAEHKAQADAALVAKIEDVARKYEKTYKARQDEECEILDEDIANEQQKTATLKEVLAQKNQQALTEYLTTVSSDIHQLQGKIHTIDSELVVLNDQQKQLTEEQVKLNKEWQELEKQHSHEWIEHLRKNVTESVYLTGLNEDMLILTEERKKFLQQASERPSPIAMLQYAPELVGSTEEQHKRMAALGDLVVDFKQTFVNMKTDMELKSGKELEDNLKPSDFLKVNRANKALLSESKPPVNPEQEKMEMQGIQNAVTKWDGKQVISKKNVEKKMLGAALDAKQNAHRDIEQALASVKSPRLSR